MKQEIMEMLSMEFPDKALWKPVYNTKPRKGAFSRGYEVALFAETFLKATRGSAAGKPIKLAKWQRTLINNFFEEKEDGSLRYREVLFMVPRKNGKTFLAAILCLYHLCTAPPGAEIYSAAGSREQARLVFDLVRDWVLASPDLLKLLQIKDSRATIVNRETRSTYKALSADGGKAHGLAPYFSSLDEIHVWDGVSAASKRRAMELYNALQKGSIDRLESQMLLISTAGDFVDDSLLGSLYKSGIEAVKENLTDGTFGFFCWQADESDDPTKESTWMKANPNIAEGFIKIERMVENLKASMKISISTFLRDHLNIWANTSGEPFIQPFIWEDSIFKGLEDPFYKGCSVVAGFDASKRGDSTGIVIQDIETGVLKVWEVWERGENDPDDWFISRKDVEESMVRLHEEYDVKTVWADKFYYEASLVEWMDEYDWEIELIPQDRGRKDRYANEFRADLLEGIVFHQDEETLNRHIKNTVLNRYESFSKPSGSSRQKIDLFVCAMLANAGRNFVLAETEEELEFIRFSR